ncbi:MAG TPA: T9SS type A sorting domain-containing protein [Bacteroidota bacterium]|nr:T9SS type A sorting domain-containing protein [Bacteroidota bacterium]
MKRFIFTLAFLSGIFTTHSAAQSVTATWPLSSSNNPTVDGPIVADSVFRSNMVVRSYSTSSTYGAYQKNGPDAGGNWVAETGENLTRYLAFRVAPNEGYSLTISTVSFRIGWSGSSSYIKASIYYATDSSNNFSSRTLLQSAITLANTDGTLYSYSPNVLIPNGNSFYLLIYPWATAVCSTKSVGLQNVTIAGSVAAVGTGSLVVSPNSLSFGTINVNAFRQKNFTVSGTDLHPQDGTITISAPEGFLVSSNSNNDFSSSINVPYTGGVLSATTIYARFSPASEGDYSGTISISGGGAASLTLNVSGTAVSADYILGIFVATNGNDANAGTFDSPFSTISKAVSVAIPGDTIFVRGGNYALTSTVSLSKSGTADSRMIIVGYPKDTERPLLNFSSQISGYGIQLSGSYWYIKGIDIYGSSGNGMRITGNYNIVEFCSFYENRNTGLQIASGGAYNRIINCDSYYNRDATDGDADGFAPKLDVGTGNYFYGCRAWQNSDDGWDGYLRPADSVVTTIENCWSFRNGYLKDGSAGKGNGNGFKMGGGDNSNADNLRHIMTLRKCLAFDNLAKGFDENNNRGSMTLFNCTAYRNGGYNFGVPGPLTTDQTLTIKNCIVLGSYGKIWSSTIQEKNSWLSPFTGATANDFVSVDTAGVRGPRNPDGSLPDVPFMHLASTSQFIDAGVDVGIPYAGSAPDLGCFEYGLIDKVENASVSTPGSVYLEQNFPNPFNPTTTIVYSVRSRLHVSLKIYNILGEELSALVNREEEPGEHRVVFDGSSLPSGIYFAYLQAGSQLQVKKLLLLK